MCPDSEFAVSFLSRCPECGQLVSKDCSKNRDRTQHGHLDYGLSRNYNCLAVSNQYGTNQFKIEREKIDMTQFENDYSEEMPNGCDSNLK